MKICKQCGQEKDVSEFWSEKSKKCLQCRNKNKKEHSLKPEVIKRHKENLKEYKSRPEVVKHLKEHLKEYNSRKEVKEATRRRLKKPFCAAMIKIHSYAKFATKKLIINNKILPHKLQKCAFCNRSYSGQNSIEYHHFNYNFMDIVFPLCNECHCKVHSNVPTIYPKSAFEGIEIPETHKDKIILL